MRRMLLLPAVAGTFAASLTLFAHVDDPKAKDSMPPYVGPGYRAAEGGVAGATEFEAEGVILMSWLPLGELDGAQSGNDCWGYVAPSGNEYAIMGTRSGTVFVDITEPGNAQVVSVQDGPDSLWRDIKVYGSWAYSVSEGGGGIQVFDLSQIDDGIVSNTGTVLAGGVESTHNVAINTDSGYLYRTGGGSNGLRIYSLADPANPVLVGEWTARYVHDCQVVSYTEGPYAGREIAFCCAGFNGGWVNTGLSILDVTDKNAIVEIANYEYPAGSYSHQGWLSSDRAYFFLNDEADETDFSVTTTTHVIDVSVLEKPEQVATSSTGLPAIDHNLYVREDRMYQANYRSGLRIFDVSDAVTPVEIGFFDTFPGSNSANFNGLWSTFPYFPSGTVIGSDIERGLFVWYAGPAPLVFTFPDDLPTQLAVKGQVVTVAIEPGEGLTVVEGSAHMNLLVDGEASEVPLSPVGPGLYEATFPLMTCGAAVHYSFTAEASNGMVISAPPAGVAAVVATTLESVFHDDMEQDGGWTVGGPNDNASSGIWTRVDPIGTSAQPEDDNPAGTGTLCWITGQGPFGGGDGEADIDNGTTTLTSPALDATADGDAYIEYYRWYSNNLGAAPGSDSMLVEITGDGLAWVTLEVVTENAGAWTQRSFRIADFVVPSDSVRVRFVASDLGQGSLVEAGVDDVSIIMLACDEAITGDLDGDGAVNGADLGLLLSGWGTPGPGDLDGNGTVDGADLGVLLANWG